MSTLKLCKTNKELVLNFDLAVPNRKTNDWMWFLHYYPQCQSEVRHKIIELKRTRWVRPSRRKETSL